MKKNLFSLLFVGALAATYSCSEKNESDNLSSPETQLFNVTAAMDYFKNQIGQVSVMDVTASSGTITRSNPMARSYRNEPDWSQAKSYEMDGKAIVKVPLQTNGIRATYRHTDDKNQQGKESGIRSVLLLVKEQSAEIKSMIVTYIAESREDFDITASNAIDPHFSGLVCFSTIKGRMISGLVVKNGKTTHPLLNRPAHVHSDACAGNHDHEDEIAGGGAEAAHTAAGIEICLTEGDMTVTSLMSFGGYNCYYCYDDYNAPQPCFFCGIGGNSECAVLCNECNSDTDSSGRCTNYDCWTNNNCWACSNALNQFWECTNSSCPSIVCQNCWNLRHYGPCPGY